MDSETAALIRTATSEMKSVSIRLDVVNSILSDAIHDARKTLRMLEAECDKMKAPFD